MPNSFQDSTFTGATTGMGESVSRFFGGGQGIRDLYAKTFQPIYANASSFAPAPNSFSAATPAQMGSRTFTPSLGAGGSSFGQFHAALPPSNLPSLFGGSSAGTPSSGTAPATGTGSATAAGGEWADLDALNNDINSAAAKEGVPANLIKGVLAREGSYGKDFYTTGLRGEQILAFNGIFQSTAASRGIDWNRMISDKGYAVWATAKVLGDIYKEQNGANGWEGVASTYFGGSPTGNFTDELGNTTADYLNGPNGVITHWHYLDGLSGSTATNTAPSMDPASPNYQPSGATGSMATIYGSTPASISFDFGAEGGPNLYDYGKAYGLNGTQHTGVDIGMPLGSDIHAPMAGTVTCAGTNNGPGADGGGCSAYNDYMGAGNGRIEIQLDNGQVLIFGHTSTTNVRPGQRINVGDILGRSGGMNGAHVHLEARIKDSSTASGWRIVDPRTILGGTAPAGTGSSATGGGTGMGSSGIFVPKLRSDWTAW